MFTATIAEILHAKDVTKFAALMTHLIEAGLLDPRAAACDSSFEPADESILVGGRRHAPTQQAA